MQSGPPWRHPITGKFCDEGSFEDAVSDVRWIKKTLHGLRNPRKHVDCDGDGISCDCFASETVMLSTGYAEVFRDGDVIQYGRLLVGE